MGLEHRKRNSGGEKVKPKNPENKGQAEHLDETLDDDFSFEFFFEPDDSELDAVCFEASPALIAELKWKKSSAD